MEFNRNQYFFVGVLILLFGIQFRMVERYELTSEASQILARPTQVAQGGSATPFGISAAPVGRKVISPPPWLGWCLISVGSVLILHSLAMRKPG